MYWFLEHSVYHLGYSMPSKIPSRPIIVVSFQPEISSVLRNYLCFPLSLQLILLYSLIFINHQFSPLITTCLGWAS